jgi:hypothetical protein
VRLSLSAELGEPSNCANACASGSGFSFLFEAYELDADEWETGTLVVDSAQYQRLQLDVDVLRLLALSIVEGQTGDVEVLLGTVPTLVGTGGVFPLAAPGTLELSFRQFEPTGASTLHYQAAVALLAGDTLVAVAAKINAALFLAGATNYAASPVGGQIVLRGALPGAVQSLTIVTAFAGAGFPATGIWFGTGSGMTIDRTFLASFGATPVFSGESVWLRGGAASVRFLAAGSAA